jgi:hypothetical protein
MANTSQNGKNVDPIKWGFRVRATDGYQPIPEGYQPKVRPGAPEPDLSTPPSGGMHIHYPKAIQRPTEAASNRG